jgi:hypothetical protein
MVLTIVGAILVVAGAVGTQAAYLHPQRKTWRFRGAPFREFWWAYLSALAMCGGLFLLGVSLG